MTTHCTACGGLIGGLPQHFGYPGAKCNCHGTPTIAECIAQLDVWNGHLEAAIDRQALEKLGQHPNDEPAAGDRDPMEQLP